MLGDTAASPSTPKTRAISAFTMSKTPLWIRDPIIPRHLAEFGTGVVKVTLPTTSTI
jgi:hypothetical protein